MFERDLRNMATVKRWGIVPTIKDQSDAEHTFFVICYVNDICTALEVTDDIRLAALKFAIWHDMDEILTGDVPGPHKQHFMIKNSNWMFRSMEKIFKRRTDRMTSRLVGIAATADHKNRMVHVIVKIADLLESVLFLIEEQWLGNQNVKEHIDQLSVSMFEQVEKLGEFMDTGELPKLLGDAIAISRFALMKNARLTYDGDD